MPGMNYGFIRLGEQFPSNAGEQRLVITSGQVCATDAILEKNISTDHKALLTTVEANTPWRMARCFENFHGIITYFNNRILINENKFSLIIIKGQSPLDSRHRCEGQQLLFFWMKMRDQSERFSDKFVTKNVIEMAVGI